MDLDRPCPACFEEVPVDSPTFGIAGADLTFPSGTLEEAKRVLRDAVAHRVENGTVPALGNDFDADDLIGENPGVAVRCVADDGTVLHHYHHIGCLYRSLLGTWNANHNKCLQCTRPICSPAPKPEHLPADIHIPEGEFADEYALPREIRDLNAGTMDEYMRAERSYVSRMRNMPDKLIRRAEIRQARATNRAINKLARDERSYRDDNNIRQTRQSTRLHDVPSDSRYVGAKTRSFLLDDGRLYEHQIVDGTVARRRSRHGGTSVTSRSRTIAVTVASACIAMGAAALA